MTSYAQKKENHSIDCNQFMEKIDNLNDGIIVDIREHKQYKKSRILNSFNAPTKADFTKLLKTQNKNVVILVYCEYGERSKQCMNWLLKLGYKNVFQLSPGFKKWKKLNYPTNKK